MSADRGRKLKARFRAALHYQPVDRIPLIDFAYWQETVEKWHEQGLPRHLTRSDWDGILAWLGMDPAWTGVGTPFLFPPFEPEVIEETADYVIARDGQGVTYKSSKTSVSIPMYLDWLLKDRASWEKHFRPRFDPQDPRRLERLRESILQGRQAQDDHLFILGIGGTYGCLRNYMGVENVSYLIHDDPALFGEMVETMSDCIYEDCRRLLEAGLRFDCAGGWEDMCYSGGPLISVEHFRKYLVPHYRRIADLCHRYGIDVIWVDCDGKIDELISPWLDAGINCMFPIEIGTWGADPIAYRRRFGKRLLMAGGFDKHILARSPQAIDAEIRRLAPLVEEGGFIPFCDHRVPPDVPLANYLHYCRKAKEIWGRNIEVGPTPQVG